MEISLEHIVNLVVKEVIKELLNKGFNVVSTQSNLSNCKLTSQKGNPIFKNKTESIDMSPYKTPVLIENHIQRLHELTGEIVVPSGTIITPKARELIKAKQILVTIK